MTMSLRNQAYNVIDPPPGSGLVRGAMPLKDVNGSKNEKTKCFHINPKIITQGDFPSLSVFGRSKS